MQASPGNALNRCPLRLRPNCYLRRIAQTKCTVTAGRAAAESVIHATPLNPQRGSPMARMGQGTCPHCGISLNFRQSSANSLVRCKGCGTKIHIPGLTHECFSSPPGPPATAMPGVDVTCLLGPLERRGVVGRVHLNTGFCACCRKKHVKQWYRHTKTGNAFYVCALTRMASIYQGGSERVATTLLGLADQVLGAGGPSAAPAGPNSTKEGLSRSVRKALEDFNLLSPQAQLKALDEFEQLRRDKGLNWEDLLEEVYELDFLELWESDKVRWAEEGYNAAWLERYENWLNEGVVHRLERGSQRVSYPRSPGADGWADFRADLSERIPLTYGACYDSGVRNLWHDLLWSDAERQLGVGLEQWRHFRELHYKGVLSREEFERIEALHRVALPAWVRARIGYEIAMSGSPEDCNSPADEAEDIRQARRD